MFRLVGRIPNKVMVACSGGVDSMVALNFVLAGRRDATVLHVVHGNDPYHVEARKLVIEFCKKNCVDLITTKIPLAPASGKELFWREARMQEYERHRRDRWVITGHTLDDYIEWYYFTATRNGVPRGMPYYGSSIKPFLACSKDQMTRYAKRHDVPWLEDPTNHDSSNARARMRAKLIPELLKINPGLYKVFRKKVLEQEYQRANNRDDWV